ncbi:MAG TPA: SbcC/MukB-like Walker B domain-containing protein, partial [Phormidium sp.]
KNHALARNEVERWRWAEIKQDRIKEAQRRQTQITARRPELHAQIAEIQSQIEQQQADSELSRQIAAINRKIAEINYNETEYNSLRTAVRQARAWEMRYQQLAAAQQQYPQIRQRCQELVGVLELRSHDLETANLQISDIIKQLEQIPNTITEIQTLEQQMQWRKLQLEEQLRQMGSLQQQLQHLEALNQQYQTQTSQLAQAKRQYKVYNSLTEAFGKKGIQAYMIENILPQLEAETNSLLARLTGNQLHVQFVTQKAGKSGRTSTKKDVKMIDTLDILIADARGTRPYETYSGGEAFRINFSIRLALARLLAQRAGTALQMLIVDEGFGTQDQEGCDRLIAAINAIANDFACILTVTH